MMIIIKTPNHTHQPNSYVALISFDTIMVAIMTAAVAADRERGGVAGRPPVPGGGAPLPLAAPPRPRHAFRSAPLPVPRPAAAGVLRRGEC